MPSPANQNERNLLESAARVFRGRMTPGSRYYELIDSSISNEAADADDDSVPLQTDAKTRLKATERLSRSVEFGLPQIGDMPPQPPTIRARIGAVLVSIVRRALFWYTAQIKAFHSAVAEAAQELVPAFQALDAQQQRQRALIEDVRHRLIELEHQTRQNETLAARISQLDDAITSVRETLSSILEAEERVAVRWKQMERTVEQYQQAHAAYSEKENLQRSELLARLAQINDALVVARQAKAASEKEIPEHGS